MKFADLIKIMVDADLQVSGVEPPGDGKAIIEERFGGWHRWEANSMPWSATNR